MSFQLRILNFVLPIFEKRYLLNMPSVEHARARFEKNAKRHFKTPKGVYFRRDTLSHRDHEVPVVVAETGAVPGDAALLHFHGGGYFMASAQTHKRMAAEIGKAAGLRVYVADYRLAPENPFPAALDDAVTAYRALLHMGVKRIVISGDSAGGGLVLALLHVICTQHLPQPVATVALCPWADLTLTSPTLVSNKKSDVTLPTERMSEVVAEYSGETPADDPRISPVFGTFRGAGPVLVHASQSEIFLGEAEQVVANLNAQGVDATLQTMDETPHVWHIFHGFLPEADQAIDAIGGFIRRALA